jgi:putative flippase GtrA
MLRRWCRAGTHGAATAVNRFVVFLKSSLAGAIGTFVDFGLFFVLNSGFGLDAQWANAAGMVAGGVVNFIGNRRFAFQAQGGSLTRQAQRFTAVTVVALALTALLFNVAVTAWPTVPAWVLKAVTGNAVYLVWTFPLFRRVFQVPPPAP